LSPFFSSVKVGKERHRWLSCVPAETKGKKGRRGRERGRGGWGGRPGENATRAEKEKNQKALKEKRKAICARD